MQTLFRTVAAIAALSTPALAQFPGDLFFSDPAPLSLDGAPVSLELAGFYGDVPVGATANDASSKLQEGYEKPSIRDRVAEPVCAGGLCPPNCHPRSSGVGHRSFETSHG